MLLLRIYTTRRDVPFRQTVVQRFNHILLASLDNCRFLAERPPTLSFRHLPNTAA